MMLKYLIEKELIQIRRNAFLPKLIVMFPIMIMCVMPWVTSMEVKNIRVCIVDNDRSTTSQRFVHRIEASRYFIFVGQEPSYAKALERVEEGSADIVAVVPPHYERDKVNHSPTKIYIAANAVNGTKGAMGSAYLSSIIASESNHLISQPLSVVEKTLYNGYQNYKVFMIPALMAMLVVMMCGLLPALNIVGEKEAGTIEQINVTPVGKLTFILAKLIPYWGIAMVVMTVCFCLSWLVYGIIPAGNVAILYLLAMLLALTVSGLGLVVSNCSRDMQQAMMLMWFVVLCAILLSGLFTPVRSMPRWAQIVTLCNPLRYFIEGMRTVFIRGGGFSSVASQIGMLGMFAVIMNVWAVASYKKNS